MKLLFAITIFLLTFYIVDGFVGYGFKVCTQSKTTQIEPNFLVATCVEEAYVRVRGRQTTITFKQLQP